MSKEILKGLIDSLDEKDVETIYRVVIRFIPEAEPEADELLALEAARADKSDLIVHNAINW